jgi:hypothetical protein
MACSTSSGAQCCSCRPPLRLEDGGGSCVREKTPTSAYVDGTRKLRCQICSSVAMSNLHVLGQTFLQTNVF